MTNRLKCFHCSIANGESPAKPQQFDFPRKWLSRVKHHLNKPRVKSALELGMKWLDGRYEEGTPPWVCGRGLINGQMAREECLSWYQPWGRCHAIAPFCWALGSEMFPELNWGFVTGDTHSVVIGWSDHREQPDWVMDILLFREKSAEQSLEWAKQGNWQYCDSLTEYVSTTSWNPSAAYEFLQQAKLEAGIAESDEGVQWIKKLIELQLEFDERFPYDFKAAVPDRNEENASSSVTVPQGGGGQTMVSPDAAVPDEKLRTPMPKRDLTEQEKEQLDAMGKKMYRDLVRGRMYTLALLDAQGLINLDDE